MRLFRSSPSSVLPGTALAAHADRLAVMVMIPLAALLASLPLWLKGPSCGHDLHFHLLSWLEAAAQLRHGMYPHWAFTPAWGAGEPRFLFYPPLSWLLGAALGLLLPWSSVPAAFTFVALLLAGWMSFRMARRYTGTSVALLAAVLYQCNPYLLFTAYERTAYGELLAAAWLPLLFTAALAQQTRVLTLAVPVALLWLTNAPAAVMGCYALALLLGARLLAGGSSPAKRGRVLVTASGGVLLGLGLAGFYLLPAILDRRFIQPDMALVTGMQIADNTLFHHMLPSTAETPYHDQVVRTASVIACLLLGSVLALVTASLARACRPSRRSSAEQLWPVALPLLLLTAAIGFLLTPASLPVWAHVPELRFLQFAWRLCALLAPAAALLFALTLPRDLLLAPLRQLVLTVLVMTVLAAPAWQIFHQPCAAAEAPALEIQAFLQHIGVEATDEYTPAEADNDALAPHDPPWWLTSPQTPDAAPPPGRPGAAPLHLRLTLPQPALLVLNLRQYPLWQASVNGQPAAPHTPERPDGLLTLDLPAGADLIELQQHTSPEQAGGGALSITSLLVALELFRRRGRIRFAHPSTTQATGSAPR